MTPKFATPSCFLYEKGFTLIEVIIALAVISISMAAVINGVGKNVTNADYLRERTLAHWVASNKVLDTREKKGESELAGRNWEWSVNISNTDIGVIKRVTVEVRREDEEQVLASVIAYVGQE